MKHRRWALAVCAVMVTAVSFFVFGTIYAGHLDAASSANYDAKLRAFRNEVARALEREPSAVPTTGSGPELTDSRLSDRAQMVNEIKDQLRREMGLMPVSLLRERRGSFVELHSYDSTGEKSYGTAGYLGQGYFITVKHAVIALSDDATSASARRIESVKVVYKGREIPATVIDSGTASMEVDPGDWAIIKTRDLDLPALSVDTAFAYEFAEPIFRLGNDYSKGIVASTGYVGQHTEAGLVTCLTDGHPGVSGGGVLDQRGMLVGIPIGRMQGDYRFSFILPLRPEMLRKVPGMEAWAPAASAPAH